MMVGYMEAKSTSATWVCRPGGGMKVRPPLSMVSNPPAVLKRSGSALRQGMRMRSATARASCMEVMSVPGLLRAACCRSAPAGATTLRADAYLRPYKN
jgi:hypothetical protein